jgi:hypothetical protein
MFSGCASATRYHNNVSLAGIESIYWTHSVVEPKIGSSAELPEQTAHTSAPMRRLAPNIYLYYFYANLPLTPLGRNTFGGLSAAGYDVQDMRCYAREGNDPARRHRQWQWC